MAWYKRLLGITDTETVDEVIEEVMLEKALEDQAANALNALQTDIEKSAMNYYYNPMDISNHMFPTADKNGYYIEDHNVGKRKLTYDVLRNLASHPLIAAIIQTRVNQVAEFASKADEDGLGFKIYLKDPNNSPDEKQREEIRELTEFMRTCGDNDDFEMTFEHFLRQITRDSLIYDQCNFEIERNKKGKIVSFSPVDAATIRRSKLTEEEMRKGKRDKDGIHYVQVIDRKVTAEYKQKDLCFGVRRPRTDIYARGYGYPELEEVYSALSNIFNAEKFNEANFTNGISTSGIIAVKSKMNPKLFRAFRREFYQMLSGVDNAKRTPLIQLDPENDENLQSISLGSSNAEMEYQDWLHYLIKIICGVYQLDPSEIGFQFHVERVKNTLFTQDPFARVLLGREKGLRPLIRSLEVWINKYIVSQINPDYVLEFTGMDSISSLDKIKIEHHKMSYMTINEIRHFHDLPPLEDGDIIGIHYASLKSSVINREGLEVAEDFGAGGGENISPDREKPADIDKPSQADLKISEQKFKERIKERKKQSAERGSQQDDNNKPDVPISMGPSNDPSYLEVAKNIGEDFKKSLDIKDPMLEEDPEDV
jgi:hypothetical protein